MAFQNDFDCIKVAILRFKFFLMRIALQRLKSNAFFFQSIIIFLKLLFEDSLVLFQKIPLEAAVKAGQFNFGGECRN